MCVVGWHAQIWCFSGKVCCPNEKYKEYIFISWNRMQKFILYIFSHLGHTLNYFSMYLLVVALFDTNNALHVEVCVSIWKIVCSCHTDWIIVRISIWNMIYSWNNEMTLYVPIDLTRCMCARTITHKFVIEIALGYTLWFVDLLVKIDDGTFFLFLNRREIEIWVQCYVWNNETSSEQS